MLGRGRSHLTYANVVSTLCLFSVIGGGAYAATKLPKNSVGARQIRNNAVDSPEVKDHSLLAKDFKVRQLPGGPTGPAGPAGAPGAPGTARAYGYVSSTGNLDPVRSKNLSVNKITAQDGAYCVRPTAGSGIDPTKVSPVVSADLADGVGSTHLAQFSSVTFYPAECPAAAGWEIYTLRQGAGNDFLNADVAFSILVP